MDKIAILYETYHDIVEEFGESVIQERITNLIVAYDEFIDLKHLRDSVKLDTYILTHAILDHFTDLSRLKSFHHIMKENIFKVKSYELSWLLRRKPLQIVGCEGEETVYVNEKFVLSYIMTFFTELVGYDFYKALQQTNQRVFDGYIDSLYYYLKFRNCNPQALELALLSFGAGLAASNIALPISFRDGFVQANPQTDGIDASPNT